MPETSQYPQGAQTADTHISRDIAGLRSTMESGFDRLDRQIYSMVSKETHKAEILRIDQRVDNLQDQFERRFEELKSGMASGFEDIRNRDLERDKAFKAREEARDAKYGRRVGWTITIAVSAASIIVTFVSRLL